MTTENMRSHRSGNRYLQVPKARSLGTTLDVDPALAGPPPIDQHVAADHVPPSDEMTPTEPEIEPQEATTQPSTGGLQRSGAFLLFDAE